MYIPHVKHRTDRTVFKTCRLPYGNWLSEASPTTGIISFHQSLPAGLSSVGRRRTSLTEEKVNRETTNAHDADYSFPGYTFSFFHSIAFLQLLLFASILSSFFPSQNFPPETPPQKNKVDTKLELIIPTCQRSLLHLTGDK